MNRSKIMGATALASVMAASAAQAEMSIGGLTVGNISDAGNGMSQGFSTNSIYVSYSDSLDNGMGISSAMSIYSTGILTAISIDTGMGTVAIGNNRDSAVDKNDGNPACFSLVNCWNVAFSGKGGGAGVYDDGDAVSGNSIAYSNSMGGISFKVTRGMETDSVAAVAADSTTDPITVGSAATEGYDATMSFAAKGSIMGATIAAGVSQIDYKDTIAKAIVVAAFSI